MNGEENLWDSLIFEPEVIEVPAEVPEPTAEPEEETSNLEKAL